MIYTNLDNFYISKEELSNSPSRKDGISEETETELRNFGTTLIQEGGCLLDLPEVVMATGQVLFHRFFCKESMAVFDVEVRPGPQESHLIAFQDLNIYPCNLLLCLCRKLRGHAAGWPRSWRKFLGVFGMSWQCSIACSCGAMGSRFSPWTFTPRHAHSFSGLKAELCFF